MLSHIKDKKQTILISALVVLLALVGIESYLLFGMKKGTQPWGKSKLEEKGFRLGQIKPKEGSALVEEGPWERDFFAEMRAFQRRIDHMFEQRFPFAEEFQWFDFEVDLMETPEGFVITCDIPGLEKSALQVHLDGNILIIEGERAQKKESKAKEQGWVSRERHFGSFSRSISLPAPVDPGSVKAEYKNGVLRINVKKLLPIKSEKRRIEII